MRAALTGSRRERAGARLVPGLVAACLLLAPACPAAPAGAVRTPAEQQILSARRAIAAAPARAELHADLAIGLARRARETADPAYYEQASQAVAQSLRLSPGNLSAQRARIWVLLGKHEFPQALGYANALNERVPDDLLTYGFLVDANAELGNYAAAEEAAQWMLDLRPGNVPGLTRAAYLRELFGDAEGALELMQAALERTRAAESEDRAWILTHIGHLHFMVGRVGAAERAIARGLQLFPDYHYALASLARVRTAQGRHADSVALLERLVERAPHAENLYLLAEAQERAGRFGDAGRTFATFERKARAEMTRADNANRELVFYYAEHARRPEEALRVAELELSRRQDVHTLDAHAWALYRCRRYRDARRQIDRALAVGIRDPRMLFHAGAILLALDERVAATRRLEDAVRVAPSSEGAAAARSLLATTGG